MRQSIRLFIGGEEVDLQKSPEVLYTYLVDDLLSPATTRNTFSKSITLPSTPRNRRVFGHIFEGDEVNGFDASKKVDFVLYNGTEIYESGYCRLTNVTKKYNETSFDISLYGGLGSLFSSLTFKDEDGTDDKKTLADLSFGGGDDELDFDITKETVKQAWEEIDDPTSKFNVVNFGVCYTGLAEDYDNDKVLVYTGQQPTTPVVRGGRQALKTIVVEDGETYTAYNGYVLAELPKEMTAEQVRDYRSYLLTPMLNVSRTIRAMQDRTVNGDFELVLDPAFFNDGNPYWSKAWVTLPRLTSLDYVAKAEQTELSISLGTAVTGNTTTGTAGHYEDREVIISGDTSMNKRGMRVKLDVSVDALFSSAPGQAVYPSALNQSYGVSYMCSIFLQLVAYDSFGNPVAGSDLYNLTSMYGTRRITETNGRTTRSQIVNYVPVPTDYDFEFYGENYVQCAGSFQPENGNYRFVDSRTGFNHIELKADGIPEGATLKLLLTKVYKAPSGASYNNWATLWKRQENGNTTPIYTPVYTTGFRVTLNSADVFMDTNEGIRSGARITKKTLLSTSYTPAEFLLSYCKLFGLYFVKDPVERKVTIMPRSSFFDRTSLVDVQDLIDRGSESKLTPLAFDKKWYKWGLEGEGEAYESYEGTYGNGYGTRLVSTGFQFNHATEDVLNGNVFKNALTVLERDPNFCVNVNNAGILPWRFGGFTYNLYNESLDDTYEVEYKPTSTIDLYTRLGDNMYFDVWEKLQLHTEDNSPMDGSGVLVFYNGMKSLLANGQDPGYILSDDNSVMAILNDGQCCHLSSAFDYESGGTVPVCIHITEAPQFSRYIRNDVGAILLSWDFAIPETFYIPNTYEVEGTEIYTQYWKDYISDLYDRNTRLINQKMRIKGKPDVNWLRRFYWFDNAVWRLQEISDWNIAEEGMTDVTFVRVNDVANYTDRGTTTGQTITLTPSKDLVEASGDTITLGVTINDGGDWYLDCYGLTFSPTGGTGNGTVTVTFPANTNAGMTRNWEIRAVGNSGGTAVVNITQDVAGFSWYRQGSGDIMQAGGTVYMTLSSETAWNASSQMGIVPSPSSGDPTSATTIQFVVPENETNYVQEIRFTATNANGAQIYYVVHQQAMAWASLSPYIQRCGATGGTFYFDLTTNVEDISSLRLYYDYNWCSVQITGNTSDGYQLVVTAFENPASYGYERHCWVDIYLQDGQGQVISSKLASCAVYVAKPDE